MNQRRTILKISVGAIGLVALPQVINFAKAAEEFIKGPKVKDHPAKQLSKHVWMIYSPDGFPTAENQGMMANITFVITKKGIVVLDTGASLQIGEMAIRMIKKVSSLPVIAIFNSHYHGDHFLGNQAFIEAYGQEIPIYAHPYSLNQIKGIEGNAWKSLMERWTNQATVGTKVIPPTHTVKHGDVFDYGDIQIRVHHYGISHTPGDICLEVVQDQVTYVGDIAMDGRIANMDDGSYVGTFKTYKALSEATGEQLWIPGHGNAKKTLLKEYGEFMGGIYETCVKAIQDGVDPSAAKALVLKDPRVMKYAKTTAGFEGNIGKYTSLAYLEAEKEAF
ncbi:MBL fold metallo-hydrolase [Polynucleobacter sp. 30F-ANTBAC]|jgi:glyoxylase-like metal-dependent hydrolase (beta-lactamase superfamily II)|uniref:MBL fold metallo-hydrolase n=1 Tax=Polynucleobacter sp. 30F-ANTBAC TaxID=2689095 RepID=UPI001C0E1FD6|nr:MBL fold metallo-hydrolase [Polynucleobacter sp. 30F-ANTBAC]MBU3598967.1 MBL fold metallo-hydrolase [Polynucleobacter sp. 30F-ANTBAC]